MYLLEVVIAPVAVTQTSGKVGADKIGVSPVVSVLLCNA